jgi:hypothetical protein
MRSSRLRDRNKEVYIKVRNSLILIAIRTEFLSTFVQSLLSIRSSFQNLEMADPIAQFFAQFDSFTFYPQQDSWRQIPAFNALAKHLGWSQVERKLQYENFKERLAQAVESEFAGVTIEDYQDLFNELKIKDTPDSVNQCRNRLRRVYVNIVDLMQHRRDKREGRSPSSVIIFETERELTEYTDKEKKWCPVKIARAEMLQVLLHQWL